MLKAIFKNFIYILRDIHGFEIVQILHTHADSLFNSLDHDFPCGFISDGMIQDNSFFFKFFNVGGDDNVLEIPARSDIFAGCLYKAEYELAVPP